MISGWDDDDARAVQKQSGDDFDAPPPIWLVIYMTAGATAFIGLATWPLWGPAASALLR